MQLLAVVLDVEVESDVVLTEVLHLEERGVDLPVEVVEDEDLPEVLALAVDLPQQGPLLVYQLGGGAGRLHLGDVGSYY